MTSKIELIQGDCLEKMKDIPDGSVDMVLTDPPYGTTACKWDSIIPLDSMWEQINRVLLKSGAVVMMASQPFTTTIIASNMKMFKYCWVWHKRTAANVAVAKYQPLKTHEDIVVFGGIYRPQMVTGRMRMKGGKQRASGEASGSLKPMYHESNQYYPKSVLDFKTERGLHPTQKPVDLMEYLIKTYTDEGNTVLDFAMGSGTTGVACKNLNRSFIGIEKDEKYFKIAKERIENTPYQSNLFEGGENQ